VLLNKLHTHWMHTARDWVSVVLACNILPEDVMDRLNHPCTHKFLGHVYVPLHASNRNLHSCYPVHPLSFTPFAEAKFKEIERR